MTITKNVWKAAALLLILCLISAVMISGTYAKYTSTYAGEDTALVAKWSVTGNGDGFVVSGSALTLDLFQHAYDNNVTTSDGGVYIIAPGVKGDFTVQFTNNSDVAADIDFDFEVKAGSATVPIEYSLDNFATAPLTLTGMEAALNPTYNSVAAGAGPITQTVYWRWNFAGDDAADTALGTASYTSDLTGDRTSYGLNVTASAVQITPTE